MSRNTGYCEGTAPKTSGRLMTSESVGVREEATNPPADVWAESESTSSAESHPTPAFPQFISLPFEIRLQIWEHFCPDLLAKSRVYTITMESTREYGNITDSQMITQQTAAARTLLAIHRESRAVALRAFPDALTIRRGFSVLRFNKDVDIVHLRISPKSYWFIKDIDPTKFPGFFENIRHLAINPILFTEDIHAERFPTSLLLKTLQHFPSLQTLYLASADRHCEASELRWCTSDMASSFLVHNLIQKPSPGTDPSVMYCWPDLVENLDFAERNVPVHGIRHKPLWYHSRLTSRYREAVTWYNASQFNGETTEFVDERGGGRQRLIIEIWPMIIFSCKRGQQRLRALERWVGTGDEWNSEDDDGKDD